MPTRSKPCAIVLVSISEAVAPAYKANRSALIKLLNVALATELVCLLHRRHPWLSGLLLDFGAIDHLIKRSPPVCL
jgi:hypothetical protein